VLHLGREPLLGKEDRTMLIDCLLITAVAFSSGLVGVYLVSPGEAVEALVVGGITTVTTFLTELYIERKIRRHHR
jgi:hypothetical protein